MSYIQFDKSQLINLEYSLSKELLRTNRAGSYSSTTIVGCNTRKYHGVLVCPIKHFDDGKFVLLSSFDETVVQNDCEFNLGIHKFAGDNYSPKGHKYVREVEVDAAPKITYRVGGIILTKESVLVQNEEQILIRYTLVDAHSPTKLIFRPFLAFRNIHGLTKANLDVNTKYKLVQNGIKSRLYTGFPNLFIQFSKEVDFIPVPDWYYNVEYPKEQERGYDYQEDLYVPGYFELSIKKGETVVFSASTEEISPSMLKRKFDAELARRTPRSNFKNCLWTAAQQFISRHDHGTDIIAGYPFFSHSARDTFISLPGLTIANGDEKTYFQVIDTMVRKLKSGLFPTSYNDGNPLNQSADASLWLFWTLQQYTKTPAKETEIWNTYGKYLKKILQSFKDGMPCNIKMQENGLIYAGIKGLSLTWMDAVINGKPVTPRTGMPVELNALWYNAICYSLKLAKRAKDEAFIKEWQDLPVKISESFVETFWSESKMYLADYVDGDYKDWDVRPNQIMAAALEFSPLDEDRKRMVLDIVKNELLTPRGLRTLTPKNPFYQSVYEGSAENRDYAYHQGTAWPWLLQHFAEAYLGLYKNKGVPFISNIIMGFEAEMNNHGMGSISEVYDGNPPYQGRGAISYASSVGALLWMMKLLENYKEK